MNKQKLQEILNLKNSLICRKREVRKILKHSSKNQLQYLIPEWQGLTCILRILEFIIIKYKGTRINRNIRTIESFFDWIDKNHPTIHLYEYEFKLFGLEDKSKTNIWHCSLINERLNISCVPRFLYMYIVNYLFPKNTGIFGMNIEGDYDRYDFEYENMIKWCQNVLNK